MNTQLLKAYLKERAPHFQQFLGGGSKTYQTMATYAIREVRTRMEWEALDGEIVGEYDRDQDRETGSVRLRIVADDCCNFDDLEGDTFDPDVNSDVPRARLEREQKEFREKVNRDGVWGVIGEYFNGKEWVHVDSCFGFVGEDWKESGYDIDIMRATIDAMRAYLSSVNV